MIENKYKFIIFVCVVILCSTNVFAENLGRAVYGIISETYSGVTEDSVGGNDQVVYTNVRYNYSDFIEGKESIEVRAGETVKISFVVAQTPDQAVDISDYANGYLYFSAKVPTLENNDYFASEIFDNKGTIKTKTVKFKDTAKIIRVDTTGQGIIADNTWHTYRIKLTDLIDKKEEKLEKVKSIFVFYSKSYTILIDNVCLTKSLNETRSFDATIKNISDNIETSSITWNQSCFGKSWKASDQYVELNLDYESINWHIKTYLRNGNASRVGLYYEDTEGTDHILPMAWRISADTLPNSSGDTLQIAVSGDGGLYDVGKYPSGTDEYAWCRMREENGGTDFDDTIVWNLRGIHTAIGDTDLWSSLGNYYEKLPKLYFAADCSSPHLSKMYTATIVFELYYE